MWRAEDLALFSSEGLRQRNTRLDAEQAVHGLDAAPELEVHAWVREGLEGAGFGVWQEIPYPGEPLRRPRHSERERCDIVLTPHPESFPGDPVRELLESEAAAQTLFAAAVRRPDPRAVEPEEAMWVEIKVVHQFAYINGIPGPNRAYASELTRGPAMDVAKLAADRRIVHAAALLVLFAADEATVSHDVRVLSGRLLDRNLPIGMPAIERFAICDRIGNRVCATVAYRIRPGLA